MQFHDQSFGVSNAEGAEVGVKQEWCNPVLSSVDIPSTASGGQPGSDDNGRCNPGQAAFGSCTFSNS